MGNFSQYNDTGVSNMRNKTNYQLSIINYQFPRRGFTLVELLIVIAIIGVLMSMLIPAVNSVREAGRRTQCSNNLRNIALAIKRGEQQSLKFPSGGWGFTFVGDTDRGYGPKQPGSWAFTCLPDLEQEPLYKLASNGNSDLADGGQKNSEGKTKKEGARKTAMTPLKVFHCPTRRSVVGYPLKTSLSMNTTNINAGELVAKSDYAANCGSYNNNEQGTVPSSFDEGVKCDNGEKTWPSATGQAQTGIIFHRSRVTQAEISDGLSNTYLVGEKYIDPLKYESGEDLGDQKTLFSGYAADTHRSTYYGSDSDNLAPMQDIKDNKLANLHLRFGSAHSARLHMAMADGSVQTLSYTINPETHSYLGNRRDGKDVTLPE